VNTHDLHKNRHRLDDLERERLWHDIRHAAAAPGAPSPRTSFGPALGVTAVLAAAALLGALWLGDGAAPEKSNVAVRRSDTAASPETVLAQLIAAHGEPVDIRELEVTSSSEPAPQVEAAADAAAPAAAPLATARAAKTRARGTPPPPPARLRGVVRDDQGQPVAHAVLALLGLTREAVTDSLGRFDLGEVAPDTPLALAVRSLGYAKVDTTLTAEAGRTLELELGLEPIIVATLDPVTVEGEQFMVEVKNVAGTSRIGSDRLQKYAIDSVEDAIAKQSGVVRRDGQLYVRGGRSGEVSMRIDDVPEGTLRALPAPEPPASASLRAKMIEAVPSDESSRQKETPDALMDFDETLDFGSGTPRQAPGSVTGGTTPPNGQPYELMYFEHAGVNPFITTDEDRLSTFAVDVDDASFTLARSYLERGHLPPRDAIRVEEFVNVFDPGWTAQRSDVFRIHADGAPSRYGAGYELLRVGLQGRTIDDADRKPAVLIFTVDVSGSMNREDRLGLVKRSLRDLVDALSPDDRVGLVIYGSRGEVVLEPTGLEDRGRLLRAIDSLRPGGSTNAHEGLKLAYAMAREHFAPGKIHRVILCSDGVANTGRTRAEDILADVRHEADRGVHLTTVGFGMGNYNDVLMEKLADSGDGHYHYVDDREEADRVFRRNLTGMLQTIARDAKVQVEFDPARVTRWRLLGYENRDVADRDFRNDAVDAGEVGAGHAVTALYELKLSDDVTAAMAKSRTWGAGAELATVRVRWEAPAHDVESAGRVTEISRAVTAADLRRDDAQAPVAYRLQSVAAEFAEILRGSYWAKESRPADLAARAEILAAMSDDPRADDLAAMIRRAAELWPDGVGQPVTEEGSDR